MSRRRLKIVVVGETFSASRTVQRIRAFERLGHEVTIVATSTDGDSYERKTSLAERVLYRLRLPVDRAGANEDLLAAAAVGTDVIWLDNARTIRPATLEKARRVAPHARLIWYCEDDMMNPRHRSRWTEKAMPLFDLWVTTKSFNTAESELPRLGVGNLLFVNNAFDPELHRPHPVDRDKPMQYGGDIVFVGTFEEPRAESMMRLAENGLAVRVWGNGWGAWSKRHELLEVEGVPIYNENYARCISASRINLCFLRKFNRDRQTCRSVEIPACGGFMLHERSAEIERIFVSGKEAAYFANDAELVDACRYWMANEEERKKVAEASRRKALESGLRHDDILSLTLDRVMDVTP